MQEDSFFSRTTSTIFPIPRIPRHFTQCFIVALALKPAEAWVGSLAGLMTNGIGAVLMRRYLLPGVFVAAMGVMVPIAAGAPSDKLDEEATATSIASIQRFANMPPKLRDEAAMILIGTALIGLAGVVRRAA